MVFASPDDRMLCLNHFNFLFSAMYRNLQCGSIAAMTRLPGSGHFRSRCRISWRCRGFILPTFFTIGDSQVPDPPGPPTGQTLEH